MPLLNFCNDVLSCILYKFRVITYNILNNDANLPIIVITHHLPTRHLIHPKYYKYNDTTGCCFVSDLDHIQSPQLLAWICGHTHTSMSYIHQQPPHTLYLVNPLGNDNENEVFTVVNIDYTPVD